MKLQVGMFGICALLIAGGAQAQDTDEHYATVDKWEIVVEPARPDCKMYRFYGNSVDGSTEGLIVRYDAATESVLLTWSSTGPTPFPRDGQIDLFLSFYKDKSMDESWGSRSFRHIKPEDTRYFAHAFSGPDASRRILRDLAGNELIGLNLGPTLMTALSLDAKDATAKLRECSLKIAGQSSSAQLPK